MNACYLFFFVLRTQNVTNFNSYNLYQIKEENYISISKRKRIPI